MTVRLSQHLEDLVSPGTAECLIEGMDDRGITVETIQDGVSAGDEWETYWLMTGRCQFGDDWRIVLHINTDEPFTGTLTRAEAHRLGEALIRASRS